MKSITTTEWLDELQRLSSKNDEGLTAKEWADALGVEHECALRKLKMAQEAGWLKLGRRRGTSIAGRPIWSPVYQIVKPKTRP